MTARTLTTILAAALLFPAAALLALSRAPSALVIEPPHASVRPAGACGGRVEAGVGVILPRRQWRT